MKRQSLFGGIAAAILVFVITASSVMAQTLIQGTVTDSFFSPIEGAIISTYPMTSVRDTTDINGFYSLEGYPPDSYNFRFIHPDYFDTYVLHVQLAQDETITVDALMHRHPEHDVALNRFVAPSLSVEIKNIGLNTESFNVYYEVFSLDSLNLFSADTSLIENMPPNTVDSMTFPRPWELPPNFPFRLTAFTSLTGDQNPSNDTIVSTGTTARNYYVIYGNRDASVMPAHNNQLLEIPVWGVTPHGNYGDSITFMHNPLASDDNIISQRLGGFFPDTLVGRWDDRSFLNSNLNSPITGYTSQSILGFAYLSDPRDGQNFFNTNGDTVLIATFLMRVTSDSSIIGDTIQPFISGIDQSNGGLLWGNQHVMADIVPIASFSPLYIQSLSEWGCHYIPGDVNWNGVANGIDMSYAVSYLKGAPHPPIDCNPPCTEQPDPFYAAMDVNGSCTVNGIDITYFVSYLKGGAPFTYCHSCPPAGD